MDKRTFDRKSRKDIDCWQMSTNITRDDLWGIDRYLVPNVNQHNAKRNDRKSMEYKEMENDKERGKERNLSPHILL